MTALRHAILSALLAGSPGWMTLPQVYQEVAQVDWLGAHGRHCPSQPSIRTCLWRMAEYEWVSGLEGKPECWCITSLGRGYLEAYNNRHDR